MKFLGSRIAESSSKNFLFEMPIVGGEADGGASSCFRVLLSGAGFIGIAVTALPSALFLIVMHVPCCAHSFHHALSLISS
jgi:hypothetical protein